MPGDIDHPAYVALHVRCRIVGQPLVGEDVAVVDLGGTRFTGVSHTGRPERSECVAVPPGRAVTV